ncbi:variant erythrocyte surface antigen beta subunit, putative [Babesia ovis]|uniref:Variant erythrocyte surface antigen beta subunit, putative n=1 Tax=Babesia ovis TaxID=5869 RepID=A0A9W5TCN2_BABOV|nr:variant erythrocyte surface antigen beta subunit, putative [Babesia ovis]
MAAASQQTGLLISPTNLKEAIDWILRLTGKDGQKNEKCLCLLSEVIHDLVRDVEGYLDKEERGVVRGTLLDLQGVEGTRRISNLLVGVAKGLQKFVGYIDGNASGGVEGGSTPSGSTTSEPELTGEGIGDQGPSSSGGKCEKCQDKRSKQKCVKYESSYQSSGSTTDGTDGDYKYYKWDQIYDKCIQDSGTPGTLETLARILLGAIPLVFSGLSYLYWLLGVERNAFKEGSKGSETTKRALVDEYMRRMGYDTDGIREIQVVNRSNSSGSSESNRLSGVFKHCKVFEGVTPSGNYATFLEKLRTSANGSSGSSTAPATGTSTGHPSHSFLILNTLCSGYFRSLHTIDSIRSNKPRTPRTIREILTLVPKVQEMFRKVGTDGKVVFYGNGSPLSVDSSNCASYLLGATLIAPMVLLTIQDTIESRVGKDENKNKLPQGFSSYKIPENSTPVPIHDLYANMQFYFSYPMSETQSYYLLQDCLVALFYQLYFLKYVTFSGYTQGYGWGYCKYGDQVVCEGVDGKGCTSWICPVGNKSQHEKEKDKCGKDEKSPLQAFLTDCLKGFTCPVVMEKKCQDNMKQLRKKQTDIKTYTDAYPPFLSHRGHTASVFGTECAVPMGFSGSFRKDGPACGSKDGMIGLGLQAVLYYYADWDIYFASLYQITRCICSLTRRVPRSTGTLYGFFYGLGGVAFHSGEGKKKFKPKLEQELRRCPGNRDPQCLMTAVKLWRGGSHNNERSGLHSKGTLDSLYASGWHCNTASASCGYYLEPLTGSLYHSLATQFCETYVSWIVHLTWRLRDGLKSLLKEFKGIQCGKDICKGKDGKTDCQCPGQGCIPGSHDKCHCKYIVFCAGVHGLLYRFGFTYRDPGMLSKDGRDGRNYKRNCKQFYERLNKVLTGQYFEDLSKHSVWSIYWSVLVNSAGVSTVVNDL